MMRSFFLIIVIVFLAFPCLLTEGQTQKRKYETVKLDGFESPAIDGKLDDACWKKGIWDSHFVQSYPGDNAVPTEKTEYKILYDDKYLYFGLRAYDDEPEKISSLLSRRDEAQGDAAGIILDSYFDHQTAYEFCLTASGVKYDLSHAENGITAQTDKGWDAVWNGKTALMDSGWTMELAIPFSQLRFNDNEDQVWGFFVWRFIYRKPETVISDYTPKNIQNGINYFAELYGLKGIKSHKKVELLPYVSAKTYNSLLDNRNPFTNNRNNKFAGGLDGKLGIGNNFMLDFTINPDFGQAEADPSVINLTAFETFFEEKRPFFVEGRQSIMNFQIGNDMLYYSRRIGKDPSYKPDLGNNEYINAPEMTTVLSALKLTGKSSDGLSVGVLQSLTNYEEAKFYSNGDNKNLPVEPLTNYFLGRVQKIYSQGNTMVGGIFTAANRFINNDELLFLEKGAYTGGMDFKHLWNNKNYFIDMNLVFSRINGDKKAITDIQNNSRHYYQRPDADYLNFDGNRTSLSGYGGSVKIAKAGGGNWRLSEQVTFRSPGLELNSMGFMTTADLIEQNTSIGYAVNSPFSIFNSVILNLSEYSNWNFGGEKMNIGTKLETAYTFRNEYNAQFNIERKDGIFDTRILRGGPGLFLPGKWSFLVGGYSNYTKPLMLSFYVYNEHSDNNSTSFIQYEPGITWRLSSSFNLSANIKYSKNKDNLQYVDTKDYNTEKRYILAKIDQKTFSVTVRFDMNITPDLSIQYYAQPFISTGKYSDFKRIINPKAENYNDRFHTYSSNETKLNSNDNKIYIDDNFDNTTDYSTDNPDFNVREFRSNMVIRWEYMPGSAIYAVWSQNRRNELDGNPFSIDDDMRGLFKSNPSNAFLIKFIYWLPI